MSYLTPPRLHFAGNFQAAPSTVNNDPLHFDNAHFDQSEYWKSGSGTKNGWWNPSGNAVWRLIGCQVTAAWLSHDAQVATSDPILTCLVGDSDRAPPAKIVDLDPEQQLVSEIWGLQVRIAKPDGSNLMRANFEAAAFMDIWNRAVGGNGDDIGAGAMYQSVLTDIEWGDIGASPFLTALRAAAGDGLLSIKFNVDGYNMNPTSPLFTQGRIVGTIGPSSAHEPRHFVLGRHLMAAPSNASTNFFVGVVDAHAGKVVIDVGNALQTATPGGAMNDAGALALGYLLQQADGSNAFVPLGSLDYLADRWYPRTAGVVAFPLPAAQLAAVAKNPLALASSAANGTTQVLISEPTTGSFVRADRFVFRLNPHDTIRVPLFASRWGERYAGARVISFFDPSQLQPASALGKPPPVATPLEAAEFPARTTTDSSGRADLEIRVADPGAVRGFLDGQVYAIRPMLEEDLAFGVGYNVNPSNFVSLLVWSGFAAEEPPTWYGSIEPIFLQYHNLYPVMLPIVDLKSYESVCASLRMLRLAFGLPITDPNSMPVTRDLSDAKRKTILRWLTELGPDGKPLKGRPRAQPAIAAAAPPAVQVAAAGDGGQPPLRGGKALALSRRLMLRRRA